MQHWPAHDRGRLQTLHRPSQNAVFVLGIVAPWCNQVVQIKAQMSTSIVERCSRQGGAHYLVEIHAVKKYGQRRSTDVEIRFLKINCVHQPDFCLFETWKGRVSDRLQLFKAGAHQHLDALACGCNSAEACQVFLLTAKAYSGPILLE